MKALYPDIKSPPLWPPRLLENHMQAHLQREEWNYTIASINICDELDIPDVADNSAILIMPSAAEDPGSTPPTPSHPVSKKLNGPDRIVVQHLLHQI